MEDILNLEQNPDPGLAAGAVPAQESKPESLPPSPASRRSPVLTIESHGEAPLPGAGQDALWHEITNAYLTHRILSGTLSGVERDGLAVVYYKGCRVAIPLDEMVVALNETNARYASQTQRIERLVNNMMGCQVDFLIRGLDAASHSIVASRRDAMLRKQRTFYRTPGADGLPQVRAGRIVQARVTAVAEKSIRIEVFGVECSVLARDLSWDRRFFTIDARKSHEYRIADGGEFHAEKEATNRPTPLPVLRPPRRAARCQLCLRQPRLYPGAKAVCMRRIPGLRQLCWGTPGQPAAQGLSGKRRASQQAHPGAQGVRRRLAQRHPDPQGGLPLAAGHHRSG